MGTISGIKNSGSATIFNDRMQYMEQTLMVGVKVFLRDSTGRYLLVRRSTTKYPEVPPSWDIPGGRIHVGLSLLENLRREVHEETGLPVLDPVRLIFAQDILRPDKHVVRLTYMAQTAGDPQLDSENDDYRWMTLDEIRALPDLDEFARGVVDAELLS